MPCGFPATKTFNGVEHSAVSKEFIIVAGHAECFMRGPKFVNAPVTIVKKTSAWEVLMYLSMILEIDEGMSTLVKIAPQAVAIREPGVTGDDDWIILDESLEHRPRYVAIYEKLKQASTATVKFDESMEGPFWGLCMVDVVASMQKPCLLDVKLGFLRHSPHTPAEKVFRISEKRLVQPNAVRICGTHHYLRCDDKVIMEKYGKKLGYEINTDEQLIQFFKAFFSSVRRIESDEVSVSSPTDDRIVESRLHSCYKRVEYILNFFTSSIGKALLKKYAFLSTSLFIGYDAEGDDNVFVYLIDYSRSSHRRLNFTEEEVGFLCGLQNMTRTLSCATEKP